MKRIQKVKIGVVLIAYVFVLAAVTYSQPGPMPPDGQRPGKREAAQMERDKLQLFRSLQLTGQQRTQLDDLRAKHWKEINALQQELKTKQDALKVELDSPEMNAQKVHDFHGELKAINDRIADLHLEGILGLRQILTAEQFSTFLKFDAAMKARRPPMPG